jgi:hypothetical protein
VIVSTLPLTVTPLRVVAGAARSGRRIPSVPYARVATPLLDRALPLGAAVEFKSISKGLGDPLSLGCPDDVARLHLIDTETWKMCREAQRAWSAFLPEIHPLESNPGRYLDPHRTIPTGGPDERYHAAEMLLSSRQAAANSFSSRIRKGALRGFGRTDPLRSESWVEIEPDAWKRLLPHKDHPGDYSINGAPAYFDVRFCDLEGISEEQAAWAYASPVLLSELTQCERWGGALPDRPSWQFAPEGKLPKGWSAVDWAYRAEAKEAWPKLLAQAAAELEAKIVAGILEVVDGLVRPAVSSIEGEPASELSSNAPGGQSSQAEHFARVRSHESLHHKVGDPGREDPAKPENEDALIDALIKYQMVETQKSMTESSKEYLVGKDEMYNYTKNVLGYEISRHRFFRDFWANLVAEANKRAKAEGVVGLSAASLFEVSTGRTQHKVRKWQGKT